MFEISLRFTQKHAKAGEKKYCALSTESDREPVPVIKAPTLLSAHVLLQVALESNSDKTKKINSSVHSSLPLTENTISGV